MAEESRTTRTVSVGGVVARFAITGFVALVVVALITALVSRRVGTEQAIDDAERVAWISANGIVAPQLSPAALANEADALDALDDLVREYVLQGSLVRVKIWDAGGTIVYSDEPRLIGQTFELGNDKVDVFENGIVHSEISDLEGPENVYEVDDKLLEVYQPIETLDGTPLLFESYFRYSGVTDVGRRLWGQFAPVAIGALIALQLVQLPFAWRMASRLREGQVERELLLRRAIDASEAERRRIASDLHDGVVQDLTGLSLGLAALGRSQQIDPSDVDQASASIRSSVKSLRSLLVEIYPPNLREEGLETAVGDLLSGLQTRGIATALEAHLDGERVSDEAAGTAYRVVQEALRNVVKHARADAVRVELRVVGPALDVTVDDNGQGFDTTTIDQRTSEGHVGLRALAGKLADIGAELDVRSQTGQGTRLRASIPKDLEP